MKKYIFAAVLILSQVSLAQFVVPQPVGKNEPVQKSQLIHDTTNFNVIVSFVADDAAAADQTVLKPVFYNNNVPLNLAVIAGDSSPYGTGWTASELREVQGDGWNIASHSVNHDDLTTMNEDDLKYELEESQKRLRAGGLRCDYLVYPFGANNKLVRRIAKQYYKMAIQVSSGDNSPPIKMFRVNRINADTGTYDDLTGFVDDALTDSKNTWLVYMLHSSTLDSTNKLDRLIKYISVTNDISIVNLDDAYSLIKNNIDIGDTPNKTWAGTSGIDHFTVGADGSVSFRFPNEIVRVDDNEGFDGNSDITNFPQRSSVFMAFNTSEAAGTFPTSAGTLQTVRSRNGDSDYAIRFGYQFWKDYFSSRQFSRQYTTGLWSDWQEFGQDPLIKRGGSISINSTNNISEWCDVGKKTYHFYNSTDGSAAGFGGPGTLITDRLSFGGAGAFYQEFHRNNSPVFNRRVWKFPENWSEWVVFEERRTIVSQALANIDATNNVSAWCEPGKKTYHYYNISSGQSAGFGDGGTLVTDCRSPGGPGYWQQKMIFFNSVNQSNRCWTASESWSSWE